MLSGKNLASLEEAHGFEPRSLAAVCRCSRKRFGADAAAPAARDIYSAIFRNH